MQNPAAAFWQIRPTPPHLTSAMAENILAAACENETRNAAKRMRLDVYQAVNVLAVVLCEFALQGIWGICWDGCASLTAKLHAGYNIPPPTEQCLISLRMNLPPTKPTQGTRPLWRRQVSPSQARLLPKTSSTPTEASTTTCGGTGQSAAASRALVLHTQTVRRPEEELFTLCV